MKFELTPHQLFVKNFLSINTPYNNLLLYHGLGTGKTCSAIGVCENMREYMKQMNITKRIIIIASPNVQDNFRLQLFDERKLQLINDVWNIEACSGKQFLNEINPINLKNLKKDNLISQVKRIINTYYLFMGYQEFSNYIEKSMKLTDDSLLSDEKKEELKKKKLERIFKNRLIVIDEVHNIRISDDNKEKKVAENLLKLVENVQGIYLLLLSATPMYNSYKEIVWLLNLMNINDGRNTINIKNIFDKNGNFILDGDGNEIGKQQLIRKSRGYVSYIRGDNPYTFPYRIFPEQFDKAKSIKNIVYPKKGLNNKTITQIIEYLNIFCIDIGDYQNKVYKLFIKDLKKDKKKLPNFENMEKFGYTMLQKPLEALNMVYPISDLKNEDLNINSLVGKDGLDRIMTYETKKNPPAKYNYDYKPDFLKKFGKIFTLDLIGNYSSKIKNICKNILNSEGIVLVYSQYLDGGLMPIALCLEENGFKKYDASGGKNLLKNPSVKSEKSEKTPKYVMITGDKMLSPNNIVDVKIASNNENKDGSVIKVVLISRAGSEGLDFTNIRQIHIMEPWYNTNRIEQIIGRGVRTCSHKMLPFSKRNVMIFLYGIILPNDTEAADLYVYRTAEAKAIKIANVSRVLKEGAVDCLLNSSQTILTEENMNQIVKLELSNKKYIDYSIGDKPFTQLCDYMEKCQYVCNPTKKITDEDINEDTYNEIYIENNEIIMKKIKDLFKEHYFYKKIDLIKHLNYEKIYPLVQIYFSLEGMINNKNEYLTDMYNRTGRLINIGEYYLFQPIELDGKYTSIFEKNRPIDYKREKLIIKQDKTKIIEDVKMKLIVDEDSSYNELIRTITNNYEKTQTAEKVKKGDYDWYKHCANAISKMIKSGLNDKLINFFVMEHIVDFMNYDSKIILLDNLYKSDDDSELSKIAKMLKNVFNKKILKNGEKKGIFIQKEGESKLYILDNKTKKWKKGEQTDYDDFKDELKKKINDIIKNLNDNIGFIIEFKKSYFVFKTKNMRLKRNKGARCDQANKNDTVKLLNVLLNKKISNEEMISSVNVIEMCCYLEFILRMYNILKKDNKVWFVSPEYSMLLKIEDFSK